MSLRAVDLLRRGASRPALMGILNVTPDSFSDGGLWNNPESARSHAFDLVEQGADIIDIGAESTRPGADPVSEKDELSRLIPSLNGFANNVMVPISVDTMKASVARAAIEAGAHIINDVSGFSDPDMPHVAAELDVPLIIMNNYGTPKTFNSDFIQGDILDVAMTYLSEKIDIALAAGVKEHNIILDPGLGFGTTMEQCVTIIENSSLFSMGGKYPVLIGPSRKRFLAHAYPEMDKDEATAESCVKAAAGGADILRVHNVACVAKKFC